MANQREVAGLLTQIREAYGISALRLKPFGPVWKVSAPDGEYGLKSIKLSVEQIQALAGVLDQLTKAGFPHLARLLMTKNKTPYFTVDGRNYILSPWYEGENPDFLNPEHLTRVARLFGKLHSISAQLAPPKPFIEQAGSSVYPERTEFLARILGVLTQRVHSPALTVGRHQRFNRVDREIIKAGPHFLAQAESCVKGLTPYISDGSFLNLLPAGFCHHDPGPRNLIRYGEEWILIDFELSGPDCFIYELTTLLNRSLEANQWNAHIFELVMNAYEMERPLTPVELKLLPYLLVFPQRFWRICRQRYYEKLRWTEKRFARRFHQIMDQEPNRLKFLTGIMSR